MTKSALLNHLLFLGIIFLLYYLISLPFDIFHTFYIEKKFNFSTITIKTFFFDQIKSLFLSILLGGILLIVLFWFILKFQTSWWIWAWIIFTVFSLILVKIFPTFIAPLFNKFEPLKNKDLKKRIFAVAKKAAFSLTNIFQSDASKRSKHSNAYFTGMGKNKQIVLFDTLLKQLSTFEIVSVLGHEIGHYKKFHIWTMLIIQTLITGFTMFLIMKLTFLKSYLNTFHLNQVHYLTQFIFTLIFTNSFLWLLQFPLTLLSRKNEFEADTFSFNIIGTSKYLISGLIKLTKENLSNPYPHPLFSWLYYSHPPLIERTEHLRNLKK